MIRIENRRITSVKTKIKSITNGKFIPGEGFNPSYVITDLGLRLSRVRVLATVVDKFLSETGKFASLTIDDGTDTIRVKVFNAVSMFDNINIGDVIDIIARIKEFQGEIYLIPEIIQKNENPNFEILRELEIREQQKKLEKRKEIVLEYQKQVSDLEELIRIMKERFGIDKEYVESILQLQEFLEKKEEQTSDAKNKVLELIESLDQGSGCDYSELIEASGLAEDVLDAVINELLSDGICFEPRPGRIKKL
ncbi:MAG: OB-fold nucleic acid binding domain-containing protein [Candidatus Aenigmatarchaeota archaeon]